MTAHPDDHIELSEAAEVLGVPRPQVDVMVEQGLLSPGEDGCLSRAEVEALRLAGG